LVQGVGSVGGLVVQYLNDAGATVLVSDVEEARADGLGMFVASEDVVCIECDVLSFCAVGGVVNEATVKELRCQIIAGAANNQLASPELADRLHERGIVYAPDYVINAGGVLHGAGVESLGWTEEQVDERLRGLGDTLLELYANGDGSPVHAA